MQFWTYIYVSYSRLTLLIAVDEVLEHLSNHNDVIKLNSIFVIITFITITTFTSNKQRNASLISCYPENNVKPNWLKKLTIQPTE